MIYTVAHIQDITERKKAEEIVRLSNIYNRSLIEASLDPLVTIGHDGKITDVNEATEKVTGYSRGELIGTDFTNYFTEPEKAEKGYQEVFKEGFGSNYELEIQHKSGKITPVLYNASIYKDEFGEIIGVFAAARDITERKRNEQELFNTKERLEALLMALPVGISFSNDPTCQIITGNPVLLTQFDSSLEDNLSASAPNDEALGRQVRFYLDGRQIDDGELPMQRAVAENRVISPMELEVQLPSGRRWFTKISGAPIHDMESNVVGGVAITVDITQRKKAEAKLKETLDNLENLVKKRTNELEEACISLKKSKDCLSEAQRIAHLGNWNWDIVTNRLLLSDEVYRIFGRTPQEFVSYEDFISYLHPEDKGYVKNAIKKALKGKPYNIDHRIILANGEERIVNAQGEVVFDEKKYSYSNGRNSPGYYEA
jgi:PAS domain S-box-containing protein